MILDLPSLLLGLPTFAASAPLRSSSLRSSELRGAKYLRLHASLFELAFSSNSTLEVPARIEPANGGFADPCLTTWLRHLEVEMVTD